jgi:sec-independent protein translocase protein TatB
MFDMSWGEVLVIGAVALIVIGPKDLPKALRTVGRMTAQVRRMAGEFQSQFNEAMREAELDEIKKTVSGLNQEVSSLGTSFNPIEAARDEVKAAIEGTPAAALPPAPGEADAATAAPLPGEPAFDLALPDLPPVPSEAPVAAPAAPVVVPAVPESQKA